MKTTQLISTPFNGHIRVVAIGDATPLEVGSCFWDPTTETLTVGIRLPEAAPTQSGCEPERAAWQAAQRDTDAAIDDLLVAGGQGHPGIRAKDI